MKIRWTPDPRILLFAATCLTQPGVTQPGVAQSSQTSERRPNGLRFSYTYVHAARQVSVAVALPIGWQHDPAGRTGFAEVMRWWLELAQRDQPAGHRFTVSVHPAHTMVSHTGPRRFLGRRLEFVRRLLAGQIGCDGDLHALAVGRARLRADDHRWLLPGSVIQQKAWRSLLHGQPRGRQNRGIPAEIGKITLADLQARIGCYGPVGACVVVLGDLGETVVAVAQRDLQSIEVPERVTVPAVVHDTAPAYVADATHERIDGPFVTAALVGAAPSDPDFLPFVLGIIALRSRVHYQFGAPRGNEWLAEFPYVAYRYWEDQRLVLINRRGLDLGQPSGPKSEIVDLLARLRQHGVQAQHFDLARRELANVLGPASGWASGTASGKSRTSLAGPMMPQRVRNLAMADCRGWPKDLRERLERVTIDDVNRVLRATLAPARWRWFSLVPTRETVERVSSLGRRRGSRGFSVQPRGGNGRRMP